MTELKEKMPANFIDAFHFQMLNKKMFAMLGVFQILQSMSFNGLFDLPSIFCLLMLVAFYVYRKTLKLQYGLTTFFISIWIQYACTIKYIYMVLIQINVIKDYLEE